MKIRKLFTTILIISIVILHSYFAHVLASENTVISKKFEEICDNAGNMLIKIFQDKNPKSLLAENIIKLNNEIGNEISKLVKDFHITKEEDNYLKITKILDMLHVKLILNRFAIVYLYTLEECGLKDNNLNIEKLESSVINSEILIRIMTAALKGTKFGYYSDLGNMLIKQGPVYINEKFKIKELIINKYCRK